MKWNFFQTKQTSAPVNREGMIRRHYCFYGEVQGVGFRFRAKNAADMMGCTGWVKNEYDGSVSMEIQGTPEAIDQVLELIKEGNWIDIRRMEVNNLPVQEKERTFRYEWY